MLPQILYNPENAFFTIFQIEKIGVLILYEVKFMTFRSTFLTVVFFQSNQKISSNQFSADCGLRRFDYGLQLEFIECNAPFWRTFAPIDTCFLGVFPQNSAFFS